MPDELCNFHDFVGYTTYYIIYDNIHIKGFTIYKKKS